MNEQVTYEQFRHGVLYDTFTLTIYDGPEFLRRADGHNTLFQSVYRGLVHWRIRWTPYAVFLFAKRFATQDQPIGRYRCIYPIYPDGRIGGRYALLKRRFEVKSVAPYFRNEHGAKEGEPNPNGLGWHYRLGESVDGIATALEQEFGDDEYLVYCPQDPRRWVSIHESQISPFLPPPPITIIDWTKVGTYE